MLAQLYSFLRKVSEVCWYYVIVVLCLPMGSGKGYGPLQPYHSYMKYQRLTDIAYAFAILLTGSIRSQLISFMHLLYPFLREVSKDGRYHLYVCHTPYFEKCQKLVDTILRICHTPFLREVSKVPIILWEVNALSSVRCWGLWICEPPMRIWVQVI